MSSTLRATLRLYSSVVLVSALAAGAGAQQVGLLPDSLVRRFYAEHAAEYATERQAIVAAGRQVTRVGGVLTLRLHTGKQLSFVDTLAEGDSHHRYIYQSYRPAEHLHVVRQWFYEGSLYLVIHDLTGQVEGVPAAPEFSPDGRSFVSASSDLEAGYDPNRIEVWSVSPRGLTRRFAHEWGANVGPDSALWAGNDSIRFVRLSLNPGTGVVHRVPQWLSRHGSTWRVSSGAPCHLTYAPADNGMSEARYARHYLTPLQLSLGVRAHPTGAGVSLIQTHAALLISSRLSAAS